MRRIIVNLIVVTRELTKLFAFYQIWFGKIPRQIFMSNVRPMPANQWEHRIQFPYAGRQMNQSERSIQLSYLKKQHGRTMAEASVFLAFEDIFIKHTQQVWQWGVKQHFPINANVFYYTVNLFPYRFTAYSHHTKHKICNVLLFHNPQDSAGEGHLFFSGPNQDLSHPISLLPTPPRASYPRFPEHTILHYNFLSGFNNISSDFQQFDHQTDR